MQHTLAFLLSFEDSKLVSSFLLNGVQFAGEEGSRYKTLPTFEKFLFKYLWTGRTSELTPFRMNYAVS